MKRIGIGWFEGMIHMFISSETLGSVLRGKSAGSDAYSFTAATIACLTSFETSQL